ncbi:MAG TPA: hypothetical protein VM221_02755 [Armatimonadota bacterium]|nr:hypothetical protein [Armatimonadota bacterium]
MINHEEQEFEARLRALPTAAPPEAVRERVLRAAAARATRRTWARPLAYALCLLGLIALDLGIDRAQSARLARLTGNVGISAASGEASADALAAFRQRQAILAAMPEQEDML